MNSSRGIRFGAFVASFLALSLAAGGSAGAASSALIYTTGAKYGWTPSSVSIDPGGTVTWRNDDPQYDHPVECVQQDSNATCPWSGQKDLPHKPQLGSSHTVSATFNKVGTYAFRCVIHTSMTGTVVVGSGHPAPSSTPSSTPRQTSSAQPTTRSSVTPTKSASVAPTASKSKSTTKSGSTARATTSAAPSVLAAGPTAANTKGPSAGVAVPAAILISLVAAAHVVLLRRRSA